ncbi:SRPBCC family protein [Streptomyces poonensis]|uniref:SRPBCC family protein n=1 Tax=Streptomyces poonensis TaxID=68255 RepID=UPI00167BA506|nr:SRPBCC family protein [Streptomyces poonensis]
MSEFEMAKAVAAPAQTVFAEVSDLGEISRWMSPSFRFRVEEPPAVTVVEPPEHRGEPALVRVAQDQMRVEWGTRETGDYAGWLQVAGTGEAPSEVTIHLSFFGEEPPRQQVEDALRHSLDRLGELVEQGAREA